MRSLPTFKILFLVHKEERVASVEPSVDFTTVYEPVPFPTRAIPPSNDYARLDFYALYRPVAVR
jgi:hypothetical protein